MAEAPVYLGAPIAGYTATAEDDKDCYGNKIGGHPAWLRPVVAAPEGEGKGSLNRCARCPKCRTANNLRLLTQIHAPLDVFDRILYLFMCVGCSTPQESVVCAFRSQLYNPSYDEAPSTSKAAAAPAEAAGALFEVEDDDGWGDDTAEAPAPVPVAVAVPPPPPVVAKPSVYASATAADNSAYTAALKPQPLPIVVLDTFPEPEGEKEKKNNKSVAEQLAEVEAQFPGITEVSAEAVEADKLGGGGKAKGSTPIIVDDDEGPTETPDEVAAAEFMARIARWPSQCIRWSPQGEPLLSSATRKPPANIPCCSTCGAPRVFEFQLMSPAVYFFEKYAPAKPQGRRKVAEAGSKAAKMETIMAVEGSSDEPHFATVSIFTCSRHCYSAEHTVTMEFAHVEPEL